MRTKPASKVHPLVARSAKDLAEVLALTYEDACLLQLRAQLLIPILRQVSTLKLTHAAAAERCGTSRSRMTAILNGNLKGISTDLLLRIAGRLGLQARLSFSRAA